MKKHIFAGMCLFFVFLAIVSFLVFHDSPEETPETTPRDPAQVLADLSPLDENGNCKLCDDTQNCTACHGNAVCPDCSGEPRSACVLCTGNGVCVYCEGAGGSNQGGKYQQWVPCSSCQGRGSCGRCHGSGMQTCAACSGSGECAYCHSSGDCRCVKYRTTRSVPNFRAGSELDGAGS